MRLRFDDMATVLDVRAPALRAPSPGLPLRPARGSLGREARDLLFADKSWARAHMIAHARDGGGRPVLMIPGFLASDRSMVGLRRALWAARYNPFGWHQGRNLGVKHDTLPELARRLESIHRATGREVALVGWSIGGVIARELAKLQPEAVDRVVTLGSPFSGDPRSNSFWRLYEFVARHKVDAPPVDCTPAEKPPVPTIALWSEDDAVVAPACACGRAGEADRAIRVDASHVGMVSAPEALNAILDALED